MKKFREGLHWSVLSGEDIDTGKSCTDRKNVFEFEEFPFVYTK